MANLKFDMKEIITIGTLLVVIGSAWATSQADLRDVAHSVKENKDSMIENKERMIRIEQRTLRQFRAILKAIKKVELEAS